MVTIMYFGEWKANLEYNYGMLGYALYLYQDTQEGRIFLKSDGTRVTVKQGSIVNNNDLWFALFEQGSEQAIVDAFAKKGVKPNDISKAEGLLEATRAHLEDMRKLVLKDKA